MNEQEDTGPDLQDLEEAHFHYIISAFEDLLDQYGVVLVMDAMDTDKVRAIGRDICYSSQT